MKKFISILLCLILICGLTACGEKAPEEPTTVSLVAGQTYGSGSKSFRFSTTAPDGTETGVTVQTDKDTAGAALLDLGLADGEDSEFGLYIKTVNGITLDYDKDGKYWAFYVNGEYAMTGVDATPIEEGAVYALVAE